tara:strand:+ start:477 stop:995 length:519 start_codon:yes stop_codon:yes gene_type:complete
MDLDLLLLILVGGIPVLSSYLHLYNRSTEGRMSAEKLWKPLGDGVFFYLWAVSVALVVASYAFIFIQFAINDALEQDWQRSVLVVSYTLFLSNAGQYVHIAMADLALGSKSYYLQYNLYAVAVSSVGFFVVAVALGDWWLIASTSIIFLHHLVLDAFFWFNGFLDEYSVVGP